MRSCIPDPRGSWYSEGEQRHGGMGEAEDCYDLIEWLAAQPWSNGNVGMTGVSYLAAIQWQVAALRPRICAPSIPGRASATGIASLPTTAVFPETGFVPRGCANLQWSTTRTEDTAANVRAHPLHDAYWRQQGERSRGDRSPGVRRRQLV